MKFEWYSVRSQLLVWLLAPILTLLLLSIASNYFLSVDFANTAFDDGLEDVARTLAGRIQLQNGNLILAKPLLNSHILEKDNFDKDYYLILGPDEKLIAGNPRLGIPPVHLKTPNFRTIDLEHHPVRVATIRIPISQRKQTGFITIETAETFKGRKSLTSKILVSTITYQFLLIVLAVISVWLGITRGVSLLDRIRLDIIQRSPNDLTPLDEEKVSVEIRPLVVAFNGLMARIKDYIGVQQRFIANAAHQLRTPLAGLQSQTEILLRKDIPEDCRSAVKQIEISVERTIHLTERLLVLSRIEPSILHQAQFKPLDLVSIATQVTKSFVPMAISKGIDLGLEIPEESVVMVQGDSFSLRELISNLIHNALLYSPTGSQVTVKVEENSNFAFLLVEDNGPGIPLSERKRVFERFYRYGTADIAGSGLGLAIVKEIAKAHDAKVTIVEGPNGVGASIQVVFRLA